MSNTIRQDKLHSIVQNTLSAESVGSQPISAQPFSTEPEDVFPCCTGQGITLKPWSVYICNRRLLKGAWPIS